jgi:hypothetical protein
VRFEIRKLWLENSPNKQQSTVELTIFVDVPVGEGVGSMAANARRMNWWCGVEREVFGWRRQKNLMVCGVSRCKLAEIL